MKLLERIKTYLISLTKSYEQTPHGPTLITNLPHSRLNTQVNQPDGADYLLPSVILWDPLLQFPSIFSKHFYCNHSSHVNSVLLVPKRWKCGHSEKDSPRKLYGNDGIVLLVSRVYICSQGHEVIAHDPCIVDSIPPQEVPFVLSHKSGVTVELSRTIISLANTGLTFTEIERHIAQDYYNSYWSREEKFKNDSLYFKGKNPHVPGNVSAKSFPDCKDWIELPSDDIIIGCFILHFDENAIFYTQRMRQFSAVYLSADHTFKVAANIGLRLPDNKWVKQYDSLFCLLNEKGQVLAWQLTKGTSFDHVQKLLENIKKRMDKQNIALDAIYVDNCCQVKRKLQKIFGDFVPVKLDLFHAISRVTQKLPKKTRHFMSNSCIVDFANVFREDNDKEKERKQATPSVSKITENMEKFMGKWKNVKHGDEENVLNAATLHQINCLMKHIKNGCISGIPVSAGSEKNEIMHRNLRRIIPRSRLGVKSALALLTCFFYQWNERKESKFPKGVIPPISYYTSIADNSQVDETFGLGNGRKEIDTAFSHFVTTKSDVFQMHTAIQNDPSTNAGDLKHVLTKALNYLIVDKELAALSDSRSLNTNLIHLMSCAVTLFSNEKHDVVTDAEESSTCLKKVLSEYDMKLCDFPDNIVKEDTFFSSLLSGIDYLLNQLESSKDDYDTMVKKLTQLGIDTKTTASNGMRQLRSIISVEWEHNPAKYRKLLVSNDLNFTDEAHNFKEPGYFIGEMGNLLAIAATTALEMCIIIFTSLDHVPVVPVVPDDATISSKCIFMGYDVASGFYHHIERKNGKPDVESNRQLPSKTTMHAGDSKGCSCGRGAAKKDSYRKFCKQVVGGIPSRCACYMNMKGCNHKCHCSQCDNPYGTSQNAKSVYLQTRVRKTHKLKGHKNKNDANLMITHGIQPMVGWNGIQSMVFDCLVDHMISEDEDINAHSCLSKYNELQELAAQEGITCIIPRGIHEIQGKLTHVRRCANIFDAFFRKQVELNWFA